MDSVVDSTDTPARARELGVPFGARTGGYNAITDVPGLELGYTTLVSGDGPLVPGQGPVRTGVTAILPRGREGVGVPCAAGVCSFNGNGELTGRSWIEESGSLAMPVAITSSHAVGAVHRGVQAWTHTHHPAVSAAWMLPAVGETWDGYLNDSNGDHVHPEHAVAALDAATSGPVAEGNVGGGTGASCYGFKGGSGTASRLVEYGDTAYTVGAFIQANFGARAELRLSGYPLGARSAAPDPMAEPGTDTAPGAGSAIVVVATDAPLLPRQCEALARRGCLGLGRSGTAGSHFSGDIMLAFSTANRGSLRSAIPAGPPTSNDYEHLRFIPWGHIDPLYTAVVDAVDEAVWNTLVAARDMTGRDGHFVPSLPHEELRTACLGAPMVSAGGGAATG